MANEQTWSEETLENAPERAVKFLGAVGRTRPIQAAMAQGGYGQADHEEGWKLLHEATGFVASGSPLVLDPKASEAQAELDALDEPLLRRLRAGLERLHPAQAKKVFAGLEPGTGAAAIVSLGTLLDRTDELERGTAEDKAAVKTLARRGLDAAERKRLRGRIEDAKGLSPVVAGPGADDAEKRREALVALKRWVEDWAETASTVVTRRDYLIRMGLAQRKAKPPKEPPATE